MTINKFEFFGIALSILAMGGALWLLQIGSAPGVQAEKTDDFGEVNSIVVATEGDQQAALANAVIEAADSTGNLKQLVIDDITLGEGEEVVEGDTVTVNYIGRLQNGEEFDNSYKRGTPFSFTVGQGRVIKGWEEGLKGMQVGGQRIIVIPSDLGYGDSGYGPIPGKATLVFAIELLEIN